MTKKEELKIYKELLLILQKIPDNNFLNLSWEEFLDLPSACRVQYNASFCYLLLIIEENISISELTELCSLKPTFGWDECDLYWFHPYDKNSRIKLVKKVIAKMKPWFKFW